MKFNTGEIGNHDSSTEFLMSEVFEKANNHCITQKALRKAGFFKPFSYI